MIKQVDVAIIGAGSAGLSALRQVKKQTGSYMIINHGPLGTTCARVGCMPSKALIHAANQCHRSRRIMDEGLMKVEGLSIDIPNVLKHVRKLRDGFAGGMREDTLELAEGKLLEGRAEILSPNRVKVGNEIFNAGKIIIAVGSSPVVPKSWEAFRERVLTSANLFEQENFPQRVGIIGLGTIGLEIGQALSRLGLEVHGFARRRVFGGLTDPEINSAMLSAIQGEFSVYVGGEAEVEKKDGYLLVKGSDKSAAVDMVVAASGVVPNIQGLGLENLGVELDERGLPPINANTLQVADLPVFMAGDANGHIPILHEALDEGFIAGVNCGLEKPRDFCRRAPLKIVFSDPQVALVGQTFEELRDADIIVGRSDFAKQSRARVEGRNLGLLHVYVDRQSMLFLGAEMAVPEAEHLAHLLALALQNEMTVAEMLQMPFYHPTVEEGLRTALRDAAQQVPPENRPVELNLCQSCTEPPLS
ncbi:MAG: dihydrolipoyl dehydrogenase [Deltaproteobacteria bacterium]|nr:dihydrolipoyl dehydrogenase [Deltaproteobacteria bacterium]